MLARGRHSAQEDYNLAKLGKLKSWNPEGRLPGLNNKDLSGHLLKSASSSKNSHPQFDESSHLAETLGKNTSRDNNKLIGNQNTEGHTASYRNFEDSKINFIEFMCQGWARLCEKEQKMAIAAEKQ